MQRWFAATVILVALLSGGCAPASTTPAVATTPGASAIEPSTTELPESMEAARQANLARLDPADQKLADAQYRCPVSGSPLGVNGIPIRVEIEGKVVFVATPQCVDELKKDPGKYLPQLTPQ